MGQKFSYNTFKLSNNSNNNINNNNNNNNKTLNNTKYLKKRQSLKCDIIRSTSQENLKYNESFGNKKQHTIKRSLSFNSKKDLNKKKLDISSPFGLKSSYIEVVDGKIPADKILEPKELSRNYENIEIILKSNNDDNNNNSENIYETINNNIYIDKTNQVNEENEYASIDEIKSNFKCQDEDEIMYQSKISSDDSIYSDIECISLPNESFNNRISSDEYLTVSPSSSSSSLSDNESFLSIENCNKTISNDKNFEFSELIINYFDKKNNKIIDDSIENKKSNVISLINKNEVGELNKINNNTQQANIVKTKKLDCKEFPKVKSIMKTFENIQLDNNENDNKCLDNIKVMEKSINFKEKLKDEKNKILFVKTIDEILMDDDYFIPITISVNSIDNLLDSNDNIELYVAEFDKMII